LILSEAARELWASGVSAEFWQNKENPRFAGPGSQLDHVLQHRIPIMVRLFVNTFFS
jgi:hypothetical protein